MTNVNAEIETIKASISADVVWVNNKIAELKRRLAFCRAAQANLRGIPARQNLARIAKAIEEIASYEACI